MKIYVYAISHQKNSAEQKELTSLIKHYLKQMQPVLEFKDFHIKQKLPPEQLKQKESELLLSHLPENTYLIALDERGDTITSPDFAQHIQKIQQNGYAHLIFAIGGAFGHADILRQRANLCISFGKLTWPHQIMKLLITEQIYRAQMILKGHPYHKD